jgi:hypothetical protein
MQFASAFWAKMQNAIESFGICATNKADPELAARFCVAFDERIGADDPPASRSVSGPPAQPETAASMTMIAREMMLVQANEFDDGAEQFRPDVPDKEKVRTGSA